MPRIQSKQKEKINCKRSIHKIMYISWLQNLVRLLPYLYTSIFPIGECFSTRGQSFFFFVFFRDSTTVSQQLTPSGYNLWVMRLVTKSQLNQSDWSKNLDFQIWFDDEAIGLTVSCTKFSRDQPATKNWKTQRFHYGNFPPFLKRFKDIIITWSF